MFDLEVKGQGPMKVIMVSDTPPYGHAPTYQISLTYLERQKCYGPDKKILFKKQLFDLEVKGQGHYSMRHTALWSCTHIPNIIDLSPTYQISLTYLERQKCYGPDKKILFKKQLFDLEVKGHYGTRHTALWSCTHIPNIIDLSGKTKKLWSRQALLRRSERKK